VKEQMEIGCDANTAAEYLWDAGNTTERDKSIKKSEITEQLNSDSYLCYLTTKSLVSIPPNNLQLEVAGPKKEGFLRLPRQKIDERWNHHRNWMFY
jgi:hypothetical protein